MLTESITVHATYKDIRLPSEHLRALLFDNEAEEGVVHGCELALHELLVNLVDHAYEGDESMYITVNLACNKNTIMIETQDTGKPAEIDLTKAAMPDPAELAEEGYGLPLMQLLMDDVKYNDDNGRNIWKMVKYF